MTGPLLDKFVRYFNRQQKKLKNQRSLIMKRLIVSGLSFLLIVGGAASAVRAQTITANSLMVGDKANYTNQIEPFDLVEQAYRGYLKDEGIPSYATLLQEYRAGDITAQDVVTSAIKANMLSKSALNDREYLSAVDAELMGLSAQR